LVAQKDAMTAQNDNETIDPIQAEFDAVFYLANNQDVADAGMDPFQHFMTWGWREGRDPNRRFSVASYLDVNPDIGAAGVNPFAHYVVTGRGEGRALKHDLGFRYEILKSASSLEDRVRHLREIFPDREPTETEALARALGHEDVSTHLHVSISHDDFTVNLGGVQLCLTREAKALRAAGATHIHLFPAEPSLVIEFERTRPLVGVLVDGEFVGLFTHDVLVDQLGIFAKGKDLTFAVHSFIGHTIGAMTTVLEAMGAEAGYFWIHDFSSVCAHYALLRNDVAFCGAPPPDSPACGVCLYGQRRRIHLAEHSRFFSTFAMTVLAPSQAALDLWRRTFPVAPAAAKVHPHAALKKRRGVGQARKAGGPLRVAFLGMPAEHKGWPVYAKLVEHFAEDPRYEFHHLGKRPDPAVEALFSAVEPTADVAEPMAAAVERLGIDVAIIWSLCPETFCFTAYEAVAGGAAVVTNPDAGNVPRFVLETGNGMVAEDEYVLVELFERGEVLSLARAIRGEKLYSLSYSRMSADFILEKTPS
jgi:hypothetical protein